MSKKSFKERSDDMAQMMVDNLNYNVLIEALATGESINKDQIVILINLAKKRNSNIEEDIKNWKPLN